jgi:hypothetical protein
MLPIRLCVQRLIDFLNADGGGADASCSKLNGVLLELCDLYHAFTVSRRRFVKGHT